MSSFKVLRAVSIRLREILWQAIHVDSVLGPFVNNQMNISLCNPVETTKSEQNKLSLWLYQVSQNADFKNIPSRRTNGAEIHQRLPLALNLRYLITPTGPADEVEYQQLLLGLVMKTFHDQPIVSVNSVDDGISEELQITSDPLTLEALARVWEALRDPFRLSVCYQVAVVRIDP